MYVRGRAVCGSPICRVTESLKDGCEVLVWGRTYARLVPVCMSFPHTCCAMMLLSGSLGAVLCPDIQTLWHYAVPEVFYMTGSEWITHRRNVGAHCCATYQYCSRAHFATAVEEEMRWWVAVCVLGGWLGGWVGLSDLALDGLWQVPASVKTKLSPNRAADQPEAAWQQSGCFWLTVQMLRLVN